MCRVNPLQRLNKEFAALARRRDGLGVGAQALAVQRRRSGELETLFGDAHFPQRDGQAKFPAQPAHSIGSRQSGLFAGHSTFRQTGGLSDQALPSGAGIQVERLDPCRFLPVQTHIPQQLPDNIGPNPLRIQIQTNERADLAGPAAPSSDRRLRSVR